MLWLYNFGIFSYNILLNIVSLFNSKAKLFITGRRNLLNIIGKSIDLNKRNIWFHFASLGEFEQGRPVLEVLKEKYPEKGFIVTFFSPSGYEIRKNYALADGVFYLPLDTRKNARAFIKLVRPEVAVFTKYEFWYHYFQTLHTQRVPLILISGIFRPQQVFFQWYGGFYRKMLQYVTQYFVQNKESVQLLQDIKIDQVVLSGDTRFDRVAENAGNPRTLSLIEDFCRNSDVIIAGSTWLPDEQLLSKLARNFPQWKFVIAPHEIGSAHIEDIRNLIPDALLYTELAAGAKIEDKQVLVIDNIGMLSSIYQYGRISYIGGGFGTGIHNTLEAAAFGLPVIFGPKYEKFQEAKDLLQIGAAISIENYDGLSAAFDKLQKDHDAADKAKQYVLSRTGATAQIVDYLSKQLDKPA